LKPPIFHFSGHDRGEEGENNSQDDIGAGKKDHTSSQDAEDFFCRFHLLPERRKSKEAMIAAGALVVAKRQSK